MQKVKCFVLMPSGAHGEYRGGTDEANHVYNEIIQPGVYKALEGIQFEVAREIDDLRPGAITAQIIQGIAEADIVIADITGANANVFLELGIRYALRRNITILMRQEYTAIPFDIGVYRAILYNPFRKDESVESLFSAITSARSPENVTDSLVFDVYSSLDVQINSNSSVDLVMSWSTYWSKFQDIASSLRSAKADGRYIPDVVIGVTNGGAMFADLLAREVSYECPVVSLWADRQNIDFFNGEINKATLEGIQRHISKVEDKINILLLDDVVASGHTYKQASKFLESSSKNISARYLPLFFRSERTFHEIKDILIWTCPAFGYSEDRIVPMHYVPRWHRLPYDKDIHN